MFSCCLGHSVVHLMDLWKMLGLDTGTHSESKGIALIVGFLVTEEKKKQKRDENQTLSIRSLCPPPPFSLHIYIAGLFYLCL